jgi:hypothetical protein
VAVRAKPLSKRNKRQDCSANAIKRRCIPARAVMVYKVNLRVLGGSMYSASSMI